MMYFGNYGKEYDTLVYEMGEEIAFDRYTQQIGKFIFANVVEDNSTRLFIQSLYDIENIERKNGWWNTFTICNEPQKIGSYIARIDNVRKDKNGYPIFIVTPIILLDMDDICVREDFSVTCIRRYVLRGLFIQSGLFTEYYQNWMARIISYNFESLYKRFEISKTDYNKTDICRKVIHDTLSGDITLKEIIDILLSPTDAKIAHEKYVKALKAFVIDRDNYAETHPYLVKKINRMIELNSQYNIYNRIEDIIRDFNDKYDSAVCKMIMDPADGDTFYNVYHFKPFNGDIFARAEAYLKFDYSRKANKKASKTAAKKAAKKSKDT